MPRGARTVRCSMALPNRG
ncbi:hypothetical protein DN523_24185 [Burkholderia multivorans]|nr:hypothetical protein DBB31_01510 [Burkholderia multivorans]QGR63807.1 hypothetical protein FOC27_20180 [Burkholderia multivorans]RAA24745.1 hypothetical protein DN471_17930 [Burkholderia multivorans]RAA32174.1 hypothetical protein DN470_03445 [Burkholderia multivorans]RAA38534.1 hypothetical protein DN465_04545 [Burkholderia multivorans]